MKKLLTTFWVLPAFQVLILLLASPAFATLFVIDEKTDLLADVGDFDFVAGTPDAIASSPGQVYEVLGGPAGTLQNDDPEIETRHTAMGNLWSILDAGGITNANVLVFGFGLNESGPVGSNWVDIDQLTFTFNLGGGSTEAFSLDGGGDNTLRVYNLQQGQNTAEARIQLNLSFDFMTTFNAASTETLDMFSSISNTSDGFEIFFLSSAFTAEPPGGGGGGTPIPEPSTFLLLGTGILGFGLLRRYRK